MDNEFDYKLRFIHGADIHLGSVIHVDLHDRDNTHNFNRAVYDAFSKICSEGIKREVDFIILSGDIYDRELRTVKASKAFYDECRKLEDNNIDIYLVRGNHDPMGDGRDLFSLPKNVHIFDCEKPEIFHLHNKRGQLAGRIIGQSYKSKWEGRKLFKEFKIHDKVHYNIGVLHTGMESDKSSYIPCSVEELKSVENINYWALGHIHKCRVLKDKNPFIGYPGVPQGRDIGEEGLGGCFLVEVKEDCSEEISFIPTTSYVWKKEIINIEKDFDVVPRNLNELEEVLIERGEAIIKGGDTYSRYYNFIKHEDYKVLGYIVNWQILGRGELDNIIREDEEEAVNYLKDRLNSHFSRKEPKLYTDFIEVNTSKEIPVEYLISNNKVIAELRDIVQAISKDPVLKKEVTGVIGGIFEEYRDIEDLDEEKLIVDEEFLMDILKTSEEIIIEKFLEKGEDY